MLHVDVFVQQLMCWHHSFWPPRVPFTKLFQGDDGQEEDESEEKGETYSVQDAWWSMISILELVWNCMHEIVGEIILAKFLALMTTIHDTSRTQVPNLSKFDLLGSVVGRILHDLPRFNFLKLAALFIETLLPVQLKPSYNPTWEFGSSNLLNLIGNTWDD